MGGGVGAQSRTLIGVLGPWEGSEVGGISEGRANNRGLGKTTWGPVTPQAPPPPHTTRQTAQWRNWAEGVTGAEGRVKTRG